MKSRPDAICQIDAATGETETYSSVLRRSERLARCLLRFGARPGDVIAVNGWNHLDIHIPYYAALMIGMPVTGVDFDGLTPTITTKYAEIKAHFRVCSPRVAFCQKEYIEDYLQAIKELELDTKLICFDEGDYSFSTFMKEYDVIDEEEFEPLQFNQDKIYVGMIATGGTSGILKLAAFKHRTFIAKIFELQKCSLYRIGTANKFTENRPWLLLSQMGWISSFLRAMALPVMYYSKLMTSVVPTTEHVIDIINKYKPVTTHLRVGLATSIINSKKKCDWTCFNSIVMSGDRVPKTIFLELLKRMSPCAILCEGYGQTENLGPMLLLNPLGPIGNCGNRPYGWQSVKLMDPYTGKEVMEPNVLGEMWMKDICMTEYYNNPEITAKTFTADGWYRTGDLLYRDEEGNYFFVERLKKIIKYRNYYVFPREVENVIQEHPGVRDVCVTYIPHEEDGEHPVAAVVRKNGVKVTAQEIKDIVADNLSDHQKLRGGVVFLTEIPFTLADKVARRKLQQIVMESHRE
ncbi:unnamed protein product [Arctia plantaginis]|uniref:Luciferin 4-monooxygenase n=1 Tax=Arctia plantaginis TaxID=874455 RepID=A0A8S0YLD2_ARCPL|nr:unnamed protein product [Arctia plantaginis]